MKRPDRSIPRITKSCFLAALFIAGAAGCIPTDPEKPDSTADVAPWNKKPEAAMTKRMVAGVLERVEAFQIEKRSDGDIWVSATRYYALASDGAACAVGANVAANLKVRPDTEPQELPCHWGRLGPAFHKWPGTGISPIPAEP